MEQQKNNKQTTLFTKEETAAAIYQLERMNLNTDTDDDGWRSESEIEVQDDLESLPDDILCKILEFEGEASYISTGLINKRFNQIFTSYNIPKKTFLCGYATLNKITSLLDENDKHEVEKAVVWYNRTDILGWVLEHEDVFKLGWICWTAIACRGETKLNILEEVFRRSNDDMLDSLKGRYGLLEMAAVEGNLFILKWLREEQIGFEWTDTIWKITSDKGHKHILQYLRDNGCPEYKPNSNNHHDSDEEGESESGSESEYYYDEYDDDDEDYNSDTVSNYDVE